MLDEPKQFSEGWLEQEREFIETFFESKVPQALQKLGLSRELPRCTAESCDRFAVQILGSEDVRRVDSQGSASYTLICPSKNKIVQFRLERFEERILELAHKIYGEMVPNPTLVADFPLPVYVSAVIPGIVHMIQDFPKDCFPLQRQLNTVRDLAVFVAKSASWPQPRHALSSDSWTATAGAKLETLTSMDRLRSIEPRFAERALELSSKLHLLDKLPLVLTNLDLAEVNIMVNRRTGHLTGVLDFDDARVEAFGICLFGVYEGFFGEMREAKWRFFDQPAPPGGQGDDLDENSQRSVREILQTAFWDSLWDAVPSWMKRQELEEPISVALDIGIINRYFRNDRDVDPTDADDLRAINWATGLLLDR